jgi:chromosome segregation ATPase
MNNNYSFINISSHSLIYSIEKDIKNLINQITEKHQLETLYYILEGLQLLSKTIPNENFEEMERKKERIEKYNKVYYDIELLDNYLAKQENDDNQNTKKILSLEECLKELNNQYDNLSIKYGEIVEKNKEIESNIDKKVNKVKKYNKNLDEEKKKNNELKKKVVDAENRFKLSIQELKNSQSNSTSLKKNMMDIKNENKKLLGELNSKDEKNKILKQMNNKLEKEANNVLNKLNKMLKIGEKAQELQNNKKKMEEIINNLNTKLNDVIKENEKLLESNQLLNNQLIVNQKEILELKKENDNLKNEYNNILKINQIKK